jgi:colicin import membrane protein
VTYDDVTPRERRVSGALALGIHLTFLLLLVFGASWQHRMPDVTMSVELWSELPPLPEPKIEAPPPPPPKPEPEPPKPLPKPEPKPAPEPEPKADIALKEKLEKDRREKESLEKERREKERLAEERRKKEEAERVAAKKREEQRRREEEKRRAMERQIAALKEQAEQVERARREKALQEAIAREQAAHAAAARELEQYRRLISDRIRRFIVLPPNLQGNPEAEFEVIQIPGGEVLTVKLKRSSGVAAYDSAVERAILRAQPLPPPPRPELFKRELLLTFRPQD